jgi:NitT/TauT family transport system substrate-binding protein
MIIRYFDRRAEANYAERLTVHGRRGCGGGGGGDGPDRGGAAHPVGFLDRQTLYCTHDRAAIQRAPPRVSRPRRSDRHRGAVRNDTPIRDRAGAARDQGRRYAQRRYVRRRLRREVGDVRARRTRRAASEDDERVGRRSGAYDLAKSSIMAIFSAHEKGIPFTVVAPASIYDSRAPYGGWLLPKDSPIKTGKDCAGLTMAVAGLGDIGYVAMEAWIAQNGGDPKATKFVEIPFTALGAAIEQRRVSGGETAPPSTADAMATGNFRFLPVYTAIAKRFCGAVFYTTKDFSTKHPQELKTFVRVLYDAARYANAHPDESAGPIAEFSGISVDVIKHFVRAQLGTELVAAQIQPTIDAAAQNGVISRSFPATEVIDANVPSRR